MNDDAPPAEPWLTDLADRWSRARGAAADAFGAPAGAPEPARVTRAVQSGGDQALRRVFDHGRSLGQGFARTYRADLTLPDLCRVLPALGAPCTSGGLAPCGPGAAATERQACPFAGREGCAWWREALHGLVNGLSSSVWYSRVSAWGTGGNQCRDLLHVDPWCAARFLPVPDGWSALIAHAHRAAPGVEVLGIADGALHVRGEQPATHQFAQELARVLPGQPVRDATARSVLSPSSEGAATCSSPPTDARSSRSCSG